MDSIDARQDFAAGGHRALTSSMADTALDTQETQLCVTQLWTPMASLEMRNSESQEKSQSLGTYARASR